MAGHSGAQELSPKAGALVFAHSRSFIGWAIRLGERLRFRSGDFYNHVAVLDHQLPTGDWVVVQAVARGVAKGRLSEIAPGGSCAVVAVPNVARTRVVGFARSQLGKEYGWLSVVSVALQVLLPRRFPLPAFRSDRTWICSALAAEAARFGGWLHDWPTIYRVVPSELYAALSGIEL